MILLPPVYLRSPVDLLQEDHPRQSVRQGDGAEGDEGVSPRQRFRGQTQRTTENEGDVAPSREPQRVQPPRQHKRGERFSSLPIQGYHVSPRRYPPEQPRCLAGEHFLGAAPVQVLFGDLDGLYWKVSPKPLQIVSAALIGPAFDGTDGDDGSAPDHRRSTTPPGRRGGLRLRRSGRRTPGSLSALPPRSRASGARRWRPEPSHRRARPPLAPCAPYRTPGRASCSSLRGGRARGL